MLCEKPFVQGMQLFPCGQCMPCRMNRRRVWTHRIMLESGLRSDNTFITLTYSDATLPTINLCSSEGQSIISSTLVKKHVQDWLKRLRAEIYPLKIRYYAVGEYGDVTARPHYHVALFGYPNCSRGRTRYQVMQDLSQKPCCDSCDRIMRTWGQGAIMLGSLTAESAQYIAGYVTKKMTSKRDSRLGGREPEFGMMSLRPGIGFDAMHDVASTLLEFNLDETLTDVPVSLRHGARQLPLGRYLRNNLRTMIGREKGAPQAAIDEYQEKMRPVFEAARASSELPSARQQLQKKNVQALRNMSARSKVHKKRGSL